LEELISWLKSNRATVGTAGVGSAGHVSALLFEKETGAQFSFVHYRGAGPAMIDLVGGHIDVMFNRPIPFPTCARVRNPTHRGHRFRRNAGSIPTIAGSPMKG
jgi:hypothetical protein